MRGNVSNPLLLVSGIARVLIYRYVCEPYTTQPTHTSREVSYHRSVGISVWMVSYSITPRHTLDATLMWHHEQRRNACVPKVGSLALV